MCVGGGGGGRFLDVMKIILKVIQYVFLGVWNKTILLGSHCMHKIKFFMKLLCTSFSNDPGEASDNSAVLTTTRGMVIAQ